MNERSYLFIAFSDPHVGRQWGAHAVPMTREKLTDRYLDPIRELTMRKGSHSLVCGGDWFDKAHNNERTIQQSNKLLQHLSVLVAGNHDHASRESALTSLQLLSGLSSGNEDRVKIASDHLNQAHATCDFVSKDLAVLTVPHHATQALFEQALYEAEEGARSLDGWKVLVIHANHGAPGGGKADSGLYFTAALQQAMEKTFDYILMGHEHLPKQQGKTIVMGSTQPCNFGEIGPRFFYGFYADGKELKFDRLPIQSQLTYIQHDAEQLLAAEDWKGAELVDIKGHLPVAKARKLQAMVKDFYGAGSLAVRVDVTFDSGNSLNGEEVTGSMRNLVQVVRDELADNAPWLELFDQTLTKVAGDKA